MCFQRRCQQKRCSGRATWFSTARAGKGVNGPFLSPQKRRFVKSRALKVELPLWWTENQPLDLDTDDFLSSSCVICWGWWFVQHATCRLLSSYTPQNENCLENRPSQKEKKVFQIPTIHFQVLCPVSCREGCSPSKARSTYDLYSHECPPIFFSIVAVTLTRWWFQIFFMFTLTWGRFPIWLIFFRSVETTNQLMTASNVNQPHLNNPSQKLNLVFPWQMRGFGTSSPLRVEPLKNFPLGSEIWCFSCCLPSWFNKISWTHGPRSLT